ncbi:DNA polymerase III subunit beta [Fusobacterium sp. MFO224]|uniref:DNA polymerase III subunit beta n=1 Tax=Fusobacterium sp. MFO224 TaxID=3378070 RepID=UPI00385426FB
MFLKVNRSEFLKNLRIVEKAIGENKIRPILSCVYVRTEGNKLLFCGTNLELTIKTKMEGEVFEEGRIVFQPQLIDEYIKEISDEFVTLKTDGDILVIETEDSSSEFAIMDVEEYPTISETNIDESEKCLSIKENELLNIFGKVKFSAAASADNLSINCIRIDMSDKVARFISTDTYRLTYLMKEVESDSKLSVSVPLNTVDAITKLLKNDSEEIINISKRDNKIYFTLGEVEIISRIIELAFPNYEGILSGSLYNKTMITTNDDILKILKRVLIFVKNNVESKNGAVFKFLNNRMIINGVNDIAKINEDSEINFSGEDLKISLNVKFLLEFLQNLEKDDIITLEFKESNSSVRLTSKNNEDYIYVVMPLALKDI